MELRDSCIINHNQDETITIYDFDREVFYELDEISTFVFENFSLGIDIITYRLLEVYDVEKTVLIRDVEEIFNYIKDKFMVI